MGTVDRIITEDFVVGVGTGAVPVAGIVGTEIVVFTTVARTYTFSLSTGVGMGAGIVVIARQGIIRVLTGSIP